ncbi:MAG: hypothetical protein QOJ19_4545 [Acidimicrobiia bacterium]|jgi:hypothetical protein|nr:hypothetical protein [Acidimicrobiia bacterium]
MRGLRLERPPTWGILVLALLLIGNACLFVFLAARPAPADPYVSSLPAGATTLVPTPAATATDGTPPARQSPILAVYGDGYAAGNELGGLGAAGWPALVALQTGSELVLHAAPRTGYASVGASGQDYLAIIQANPVPEAAVTVVFGSRNDADEDLARVQANATLAITAAQVNAPASRVVVVGPVWDDADVPAGVVAVRDVVKAAAQAAGATFVDPLAEGWFAQQAGLIADDGISPNDAGHAYLAQRIVPAVTAALAPTP